MGSPKWHVTDACGAVEATFQAQVVKDLSPLAGLYTLTSVNVAVDEDTPNAIVDVHPLATLENLKELDVTGNPIADFKPLDALVRDNGLVIKGR